MTDIINVAHVNQYSQNIEMLLQDKGSKLLKGVRQQTFNGKGAKVVEQIGRVELVDIQGRHTDTDIVDVPHDARWAFPHDKGGATMVDREDLLRTLIDPKSSYAMQYMAAAGRAIDEFIIDAFFTDQAKVGENGTTNVTYVNDGGGVVDAAGANTMTIAKLITGKTKLMEKEVDLDNEEIFCAITATQHENLMNETRMVNLDYNTTAVLVEGKITSFLGINFIHKENLPLDGSGKRLCPMWAKSGMVLGSWGGIETSIDRIPTKWNNTQIMIRGTWGSTRTEGGKIVKLVCDEP